PLGKVSLPVSEKLRVLLVRSRPARQIRTAVRSLGAICVQSGPSFTCRSEPVCLPLGVFWRCPNLGMPLKGTSQCQFSSRPVCRNDGSAPTPASYSRRCSYSLPWPAHTQSRSLLLVRKLLER